MRYCYIVNKWNGCKNLLNKYNTSNIDIELKVIYKFKINYKMINQEVNVQKKIKKEKLKNILKKITKKLEIINRKKIFKSLKKEFIISHNFFCNFSIGKNVFWNAQNNIFFVINKPFKEFENILKNKKQFTYLLSEKKFKLLFDDNYEIKNLIKIFEKKNVKVKFYPIVIQK